MIRIETLFPTLRDTLVSLVKTNPWITTASLRYYGLATIFPTLRRSRWRDWRIAGIDCTSAVSKLAEAEKTWSKNNPGPSFTITATAKILGLNEQDISDLAAAGILRIGRFGQSCQVYAAEIHEFLCKAMIADALLVTAQLNANK